MKTLNKWVKIGEVTRTGFYLFKRRGFFQRYAVFEFIETDGNRKYKEIYMCAESNNVPIVNSQSE